MNDLVKNKYVLILLRVFSKSVKKNVIITIGWLIGKDIIQQCPQK